MDKYVVEKIHMYTYHRYIFKEDPLVYEEIDDSNRIKGTLDEIKKFITERYNVDLEDIIVNSRKDKSYTLKVVKYRDQKETVMFTDRDSLFEEYPEVLEEVANGGYYISERYIFSLNRF